MTSAYFDEATLARARLVWTIATRRQVERWERLVASYWRAKLEGHEPDNAEIWFAQIEHHFALIAARNLLRALALPPASQVRINATLRAEVIEGRDLHEHWDENLPVFNVEPRLSEPAHRTGKEFARRNPAPGNWPYWWLGWAVNAGPMLLPNVWAPELRDLLDAIEAEVLVHHSGLREFVPPLAPSSWIHENGEWWPGADLPG